MASVNASMMEPYAAIGVVILIVTGITAAMLILAHTIGPKRHGPVKDSPYESGVPVIADARRRFNVRFYIVAMLFLLFDVEVVFLWPWALAFHDAAANGTLHALETGALVGKGFLLLGMSVFFVLLVFGLVYEWKKGAFEWD
jgi:NADH-quinone oxidoreductase subunit A